MSTDVGIRELKAKLSECVRRAAGGERIIVTDRGRPVAQLTSLDGTTLDDSETVRQLMAAEQVRVTSHLTEIEVRRKQPAPSAWPCSAPESDRELSGFARDD